MSVERGWVAVPPGAGRSVTGASGDKMVIKVGGEDTAGLAAVFEQVCAPGSGPPIHIHHECAEMFYVLEGEFVFRVGNETVQAPTGTWLFVRAGLQHTYVNSGTNPGRVLFWTTPAARMVGWFSELAELPPGPRDPTAVQTIAQRHGVEVVGPPIDVKTV